MGRWRGCRRRAAVGLGGGFGAALADQLAGGLQYRSALMPSMDGNTVEMATEQAAFAENAVAYSASLSFVRGKVETLTRALRGE